MISSSVQSMIHNNVSPHLSIEGLRNGDGHKADPNHLADDKQRHDDIPISKFNKLTKKEIIAESVARLNDKDSRIVELVCELQSTQSLANEMRQDLQSKVASLDAHQLLETSALVVRQ